MNCVSEKPFALYNGESKLSEHSTLKEVFASYRSGYTVKLQSDYTLTDAELYSGYGSFSEVNIDLAGYSVISGNSKNSFICVKATSTDKTPDSHR